MRTRHLDCSDRWSAREAFSGFLAKLVEAEPLGDSGLFEYPFPNLEKLEVLDLEPLNDEVMGQLLDLRSRRVQLTDGHQPTPRGLNRWLSALTLQGKTAPIRAVTYSEVLADPSLGNWDVRVFARNADDELEFCFEDVYRRLYPEEYVSEDE